jgi:hypothetical protein
MRKYPFRAITVATKEIGRCRTITSVKAGEFLAMSGEREGPDALKGTYCLSGCGGKRGRYLACRDAFIDAAKDSVGEGRY